MKLLNTSVYKFIQISFLVLCSLNTNAQEDNLIEGYWLTSASIVEVKKCDNELCATIEHIFVEEGVDPKSILDNNNKKKSLRNRPLVGINLLEDFEYTQSNETHYKEGKIYDPGRGRVFKSNLQLLENGNLKVEGCLMRVCGHEEWQPLNIILNKDGTRSAELKN
jgi:uncharacterized protein (DUF2147 family)